jgi:hypothetical protein
MNDRLPPAKSFSPFAMIRIVGWFGALAWIATAMPREVHAEEPMTEAAVAADRAFNEAQVLMKQGKYTEACARYAESQRLESGIGTLLRLGDCFEKTGRPNSALRSFQQAEALAAKKGDDRQALAASRAAVADAAVPRLTLRVPSGLVANVNGTAWSPDQLNTAIPVDPGRYQIVVTTKNGTVVLNKSVQVAEKSSLEVDATTSAIATDDAPGKGDASFPWWKTTGIVVGAVGLAAVGTGLVFGFGARQVYADTEGNCTPACRDTDSFQKRESAYTRSQIGTVSLVAGAVLLASGVTLLLWPRSDSGKKASARGVVVAW